MATHQTIYRRTLWKMCVFKSMMWPLSSRIVCLKTSQSIHEADISEFRRRQRKPLNLLEVIHVVINFL